MSPVDLSLRLLLAAGLDTAIMRIEAQAATAPALPHHQSATLVFEDAKIKQGVER